MTHSMDDGEICRLLDEFSDLSDDDSVADPTYENETDTILESEESSPEDHQLTNEQLLLDAPEEPQLSRSAADEEPAEWVDIEDFQDFEPRFEPSRSRQCTIRSDLSRNSSALQIFL
ncbi:hypothetical protein SK128_010920 [Halocaridina rubra]|uniref:Uncharacterized protein n=1 Tax=Halocaridina rubra TaxID=373956 RepID=A0AAN8X3P9_HALRR